MNNKEVIYYKDELNDEFSKAKIEAKKIDENYNYKHNFIWEICSYIIQNIISMPIKLGYEKIKFKLEYERKRKV